MTHISLKPLRNKIIRNYLYYYNVILNSVIIPHEMTRIINLGIINAPSLTSAPKLYLKFCIRHDPITNQFLP